jgi:predicted nucleotidyltransferase
VKLTESKTQYVPGLNKITANIQETGTIIKVSLAGSHAYNLDTEDSDYDLNGIYVLPTADFFHIDNKPKESIHRANVPCITCTRETYTPFYGAYGTSRVMCPDCWDTRMMPDYTFHEVGKFMKLAAQGNPTMIEMLYTDSLIERNEDWENIHSIRAAFLSQNIHIAYSGYVKAQLKKLLTRITEGKEGYSGKVRTRTKKHTRHIVRLLLQEEQLISGNRELTVRLNDEQRKFVLLTQDWDSSELIEWVESKQASYDQLAETLPKKPDYDTINNLLLNIRKRHLQK